MKNEPDPVKCSGNLGFTSNLETLDYIKVVPTVLTNEKDDNRKNKAIRGSGWRSESPSVA